MWQVLIRLSVDRFCQHDRVTAVQNTLTKLHRCTVEVKLKTSVVQHISRLWVCSNLVRAADSSWWGTSVLRRALGICGPVTRRSSVAWINHRGGEL